MKKVIAGITAGVATLLLCVFMAACASSFTGTYKFYSMNMEMGGMSVNYEVGKEYMGVTISEDAFKLTINEDNTWTMETSMAGNENTTKGTWEEKDGKYYLTAEGEDDVIEATLDGNKISFEQEGMKITLKK